MDWKLFTSTFALIFISELPDKTAFASVLMATRNKPLPVFIGAAAAFVVQSAVAVTFGSILTLLPAKWVHIGAALMFFVLAFSMWRREEPNEQAGDSKPAGSRFFATVSSAFVLIFIAEWGDLTQLATAALAAKYAAPFTIFISATLALWMVTAIGVIVGHGAKRTIQPKVLQRVAAVAFVVVGMVLLAGAR
jgi:putative Ca2+/H+ antiporter (TMEM165/GDT1 family)